MPRQRPDVGDATTAKTMDALPATGPRPRQPAPQVRLVFGPDLSAADDGGAAIPLRGPRVIGRSRRCDWTLTDRTVSGVHAELAGGRLRDRGSRGGTFVNGRRLDDDEPYALAPADVVRLGGTLLVVTPDQPRTAGTPHLTGTSPHLAAIDDKLALIRSPTARVLVTGPPGAGKERVAKAVADRVAELRGRREVGLVAFNAASIPKDLQEPELFGAERGAFTGAVARPGYFAQARGAVLFLDEIGEAGPALQAKLLRAIQRDGAYRPVGGKRDEPVDACLVFGTNRNLDDMVAEGRFRADLLSRMRDEHLVLPGVDARREDILELMAAELETSVSALPLDAGLAERILLAHHPGHVRDLLALAGRLDARRRHLGRDLGAADADALGLVAAPHAAPHAAPAPAPPAPRRTPPCWRDPATFANAWARHRGSVRAVAAALGCDEKTVRKWRLKHEL